MPANDDVVLYVPFSCAWVSRSLYREADGPDPFLADDDDLAQLVDELGGTRVEIDGWDEALTDAWAEAVGSGTAVCEWVRAYRDARGDADLVVTFTDATRVVGRRGDGYFGVTYPARLLLEHEDRAAAMRAAIVTIMDRHVRGAALGVPPLSEVYAAG